MSSKKKRCSVRKTCDFCVRRKRPCDGFGRRRCSFCIATKQPVCLYRPRQRWGSQTSRNDFNTAGALVGRSFWRTDGEIAPALTREDGRLDQAGSGSGDRRPLLPLKRGRFGASPATGLIGLQENEFLGDFFRCLGLLSLASESTVRGAMVEVMLAGAASQQTHHQGAPSASFSSPGLVGEESGDVVDSGWSNALAAEKGPGALPRDPSTCVLWCAIALGALVRGSPLDHVARYVELAQDSLWACYDGSTLGTARAYLAMAVLHNICGEEVKSYQCVKLANSIVDALPPEEIPVGFPELLKYAGFAWAIEPELAPVEDTNSYWKNVPPIWRLSDSVMERDVSCFLLSVVVPLNQPLMDEASASHVLAKQQQQPSEVAPVATLPPVENPDLQDAEEVDRVCIKNAEACAEVHKPVMSEMLRLGECIESELTYLQLLNKEASMMELRACIQGLHYVHIMLQFLAMFESRQGYEATRVAYNSARPVGSPPAPPLGAWRMSDVCDRPCCRRLTVLLQSAFRGYSKARPKRPVPGCV